MKQTVVVAGALFAGYVLGVVATHEQTKRMLAKILEDESIQHELAHATERALAERKLAMAGRN